MPGEPEGNNSETSDNFYNTKLQFDSKYTDLKRGKQAK